MKIRFFSKEKNKSELIKEVSSVDSSEFESLDQIVKNKGLKAYSDLLYDEQVKFCLSIKKFLILSGGWEIEDNGSPKEIVDFVKINLSEHLVRSLSSIIYSMFSAFEYGFSVSEIVYQEIGDKICLKNIKTKFPYNFQFEYDEFGNLSKLLDVNGKELNIEKFLIYSYMSEFGNIEGESDLKAIYNAVWFKEKILKFWARYIERFSAPIVKGKIPVGAQEDEALKFQEVIKKIHNISVVTIPTNPTGNNFDFELVETKKDGGTQFKDAIENANERITRGLLIPTLFGAGKISFGSYALGSLQFDVVYRFLRFIGENFADEVMNKQLIKRLVDINFNNVTQYPKFKFKEIVMGEYNEKR